MRRDMPRHVRCKFDQRPLQDIGEDQVEGGRSGDFGVSKARSLDAGDAPAKIVAGNIRAGDIHRNRVDIRGDDRLLDRAEAVQ